MAVSLVFGIVFFIVSTRLNRVEESGYYCIDPNGKILNRDLKYQVRTAFNDDGIAFVYGIRENGELKSGFIDEKGNIKGELFSKEDINIKKSVSFPILVRDSGKLVILNEDFCRIGQVKEDYGSKVKYFDSIFHQGLAMVLVEKDGEELWGYINTAGEWIVEPQYKTAGHFIDEGIAQVQETNDKWGIIKTDGSYITDERYFDVSCFKDGYAMVKNSPSGAAAFINAEGEYITDFIYEFDSLNPGFSEGLTYVRLQGEEKYGYINEQGEMVIEPIFDNAHEFSQGLASISGYQYIDKNGNIVIDNHDFGDVEPFSDEGYAIVKVWQKMDGEEVSARYGIIDTKGNWVYEPQFVAKKDEKDRMNNLGAMRTPIYKNGYLIVYLEKGQSVKKAKIK